MIKMLPKYYLNDYFTLVDSPLMKEKEFIELMIGLLIMLLNLMLKFSQDFSIIG